MTLVDRKFKPDLIKVTRLRSLALLTVAVAELLVSLLAGPLHPQHIFLHPHHCAYSSPGIHVLFPALLLRHVLVAVDSLHPLCRHLPGETNPSSVPSPTR